MDAEERAWELLRWSSPAPLAPFSEELAAEGFYTRVQKERSDKALDEWDKKNPYEPSTELQAFRELESIGVLTQADFFSPDKANRSPRYIDPNDRDKGEKYTSTSYKDDLKRHKQRLQSSGTQPEGEQGIPTGRRQEDDSSQGVNQRSGIPEAGSRLDDLRQGSNRTRDTSGINKGRLAT